MAPTPFANIFLMSKRSACMYLACRWVACRSTPSALMRSAHSVLSTLAACAMIRRRSAIKPAIGHMRTDGKLDRNWYRRHLNRIVQARPITPVTFACPTTTEPVDATEPFTCQSRATLLRLGTSVSHGRSDKSRRSRTKCCRQLEILDFRYSV